MQVRVFYLLEVNAVYLTPLEGGDWAVDIISPQRQHHQFREPIRFTFSKGTWGMARAEKLPFRPYLKAKPGGRLPIEFVR